MAAGTGAAQTTPEGAEPVQFSCTGQGDRLLVEGDAVRLVFAREREFSGEYQVAEDGFVSFPLVGNQRVAGCSVTELRDLLQGAYYRLMSNEEIQIVPLHRIRVVGAVRDPGLYHVDATMDWVDVVAQAGGPTREGRVTSVVLVRGGEETRLELPVTEAGLDRPRSNDTLIVPERSWFSRNSTFVAGGALSLLTLFVRIAFF